jgi:hypothetical protein
MSYYLHHVIVHFTLVIGYALAAMTTTHFTFPYGPDMRSTMTSLCSVNVRSVIECGIKCHTESLCHGANYVRGTGNCELISEYTLVGAIETRVGTQYIAGPGV